MARVFVVQEREYDFTEAERFGDLEFMSVDGRHDFHNVVDSQHNTQLLVGLRAQLHKYDPDNDYIIIAGSPYVAAAVFWLLGHMGIRQLRLLRWDNRDRVYIPLILKLTFVP